MSTQSKTKLLLSPIKWAIGSWSFFIGENLLLSENRTYIIQNICQNNDDYYHYLYGLCSTTAVGSIVYAYYGKIRPFSFDERYRWLHLWDASKSTIHINSRISKSGIPLKNRIGSFVVMSIGLCLLSQTLPKFQIPLEYIGSSSSTATTTSENDDINNTTENKQSGNNQNHDKTTNNDKNNTNNTKWKVRCPFDFTDSKSKHIHNSNNQLIISSIHDIHGIDRITRHPGLWSFGLISFGSSFLSPCIPTKIYFTMPLVMAFIGGYHHDSRFQRGIGGSFMKGYEELTSNVPFYAWIVGKQGHRHGQGQDDDDTTTRLALMQEFYEKEVKGLNLVLGMGVAALYVMRKGRGR